MYYLMYVYYIFACIIYIYIYVYGYIYVCVFGVCIDYTSQTQEHGGVKGFGLGKNDVCRKCVHLDVFRPEARNSDSPK